MIGYCFARGARKIRKIYRGSRLLSVAASREDLIKTEIDEESAIACVTMQNAPVNALSLEMQVLYRFFVGSLRSTSARFWYALWLHFPNEPVSFLFTIL